MLCGLIGCGGFDEQMRLYVGLQVLTQIVAVGSEEAVDGLFVDAADGTEGGHHVFVERVAEGEGFFFIVSRLLFDTFAVLPQAAAIPSPAVSVKGMGGGTEADVVEEVPEKEKNYPECKMFDAHALPAYGFRILHANVAEN